MMMPRIGTKAVTKTSRPIAGAVGTPMIAAPIQISTPSKDAMTTCMCM